jgi:hypothetical protein
LDGGGHPVFFVAGEDAVRGFGFADVWLVVEECGILTVVDLWRSAAIKASHLVDNT